MQNAGHDGPALQADSSDLAISAHASTAKRSATHRKETVLSESLVIDRFWRNRRGEAIVTSLEPYEGRAILHVRTYFTDKAGKLAPTRKGIAIAAARLPDLHAALGKAMAKAIELGLLKDEDSD